MGKGYLANFKKKVHFTTFQYENAYLLQLILSKTVIILDGHNLQFTEN